MWKKPHSFEAKERDSRQDELKGFDTSKTGSCMEVLDASMVKILMEKIVSLHEDYINQFAVCKRQSLYL